jgi:hypothetical protein
MTLPARGCLERDGVLIRWERSTPSAITTQAVYRPEAISQGRTIKEAVANVLDALRELDR